MNLERWVTIYMTNNVYQSHTDHQIDKKSITRSGNLVFPMSSTMNPLSQFLPWAIVVDSVNKAGHLTIWPLRNRIGNQASSYIN